MHIDAVKQTSQTFRVFLNNNDVDKVAKMQDTLCGMIEDACEINEVLNETNVDMDESEIEEEYEALYAEIQLPVAPTTSLMYESMETNFEEIPLTLTS